MTDTVFVLVTHPEGETRGIYATVDDAKDMASKLTRAQHETWHLLEWPIGSVTCKPEVVVFSTRITGPTVVTDS